ncbi:MAG: DJ-1/PfpI family protein [Oscillospiraceae bacterium]|nr:DJ-1/PfpI family protein [Oscillospiraceae bacterium]
MKKTVMLFANGFEEVEALTVVDLLRRAEIVCDIVALDGAATVTGSHNITVSADKAFADVTVDAYDALLLPGGQPGTTNLGNDNRVLALLRAFHDAGKLTAAICAAPTVLAKAGLLEGRRATCYPGLEGKLTGAAASTEHVVEDGAVITSRGVGTAIPFALSLVAYLDSQERADALAKSIVYC